MDLTGSSGGMEEESAETPVEEPPKDKFARLQDYLISRFPRSPPLHVFFHGALPISEPFLFSVFHSFKEPLPKIEILQEIASATNCTVNQVRATKKWAIISYEDVSNYIIGLIHFLFFTPGPPQVLQLQVGWGSIWSLREPPPKSAMTTTSSCMYVQQVPTHCWAWRCRREGTYQDKGNAEFSYLFSVSFDIAHIMFLWSMCRRSLHRRSSQLRRSRVWLLLKRRRGEGKSSPEGGWWREEWWCHPRKRELSTRFEDVLMSWIY